MGMGHNLTILSNEEGRGEEVYSKRSLSSIKNKNGEEGREKGGGKGRRKPKKAGSVVETDCTRRASVS